MKPQSGLNALFAACGLVCAAHPDAASAQAVRRDAAPLDLPRPGYEYDGYTAGSFVILPQLELSSEYDSNLFATSTNPVDDFRFDVAPSIKLKRDSNTSRLQADIYGRFRRHADNPREDSNAFGGSGSYALSTASGRRAYLTAGYDRAIESRGDPETRAGPTDKPRRIDDFKAEAAWREPLGRFFVETTLSAEKVNYLDPAENDRDLAGYRSSVRLAYRASAATNLFLEGYVNRRDFRLPADFSGVDRDATTVGVNAGIQKEIGQRLRGRIGIGLFRADPDSPVLKAFTGFAATGDVIWNPRVRTAVSFRISRGDVATVRSGATGRIDTTVRLGIDQEVRHNLLIKAAVSYTDRSYRGSARGHLRTAAVEGETEFLLNRHVSVFARGTYADRNAPGFADRFERATAQIGLRWKL